MSVFKRNKTFHSKTKEDIKDSELKKSNNNIKKKKIGFGRRDKKVVKNNEIEKIIDEDKKIINNTSQIVTNEEKITNIIDEDFLFEDIVPSKEKNKDGNVYLEKKEEWSKSKRKTFIKKDMKDKPVILEDTGEKIGMVFDSIYDEKQNLVGYKIKDIKSESVLSFSLDQFGEDKRGLIFIPNWYTKGVKSIEKLEFKDRICPELTWLLKDKTISEEELYNIFIKHDDEVSNYIEDTAALRELLNSRLQILERERITLKEDLMDLTEKRLIKDIDRREFSEVVMNHRKKVNVLDVNIKKSKELIERLEQTSFGILSRDISLRFEKEEGDDKKFSKKKKEIEGEYVEMPHKYNDAKVRLDELQEENNLLKSALEKKIEYPYEDKYNNLKKNYEELQEEYGELKLAVEKLLDKYDV